MVKWFVVGVLGLLGLVVAFAGQKAPVDGLVNGDFGKGLDGWLTTENHGGTVTVGKYSGKTGVRLVSRRVTGMNPWDVELKQILSPRVERGGRIESSILGS